MLGQKMRDHNVKCFLVNTGGWVVRMAWGIA